MFWENKFLNKSALKKGVLIKSVAHLIFESCTSTLQHCKAGLNEDIIWSMFSTSHSNKVDHLHGESHEDGTHDPSSIVPLPDDVLVGLLPLQAGAGQVHLINLQILLQLGFSFVFSFLVGPIILVAWKPKKVSEETNFSFLTCNYPALPSLPVWVWVTDTESLRFIYRNFGLQIQKVWVSFTESLNYIYRKFELHLQKVWVTFTKCLSYIFRKFEGSETFASS